MTRFCKGSKSYYVQHLLFSLTLCYHEIRYLILLIPSNVLSYVCPFIELLKVSNF